MAVYLIFKNIRLLPPLSVLLPLITFCICYAIGIAKKVPEIKPYPFIPFISSVISYHPQSGIATVVISIAAASTALIGIARYLQVESYKRKDLHRLNIASLVCGIIVAITEVWVPAFDVLIVFQTHVIGTAIFFLSSSLYVTLYAIIAIKITPRKTNLVAKGQLCLAVLIWSSVIIVAVCLMPPMLRYNEAGWSIGPIAEWIWFSLLAMFFCTLATDLNKIKLKLTLHEEGYTPTRQIQHLAKKGQGSLVPITTVNIKPAAMAQEELKEVYINLSVENL